MRWLSHFNRWQVERRMTQRLLGSDVHQTRKCGTRIIKKEGRDKGIGRKGERKERLRLFEKILRAPDVLNGFILSNLLCPSHYRGMRGNVA